MTYVTLQYLGNGQFRAVRPDQCDGVVVGKAAAWRMVEKRSRKSHDHFFACVDEAWSNLPESMVGNFPSSEHLRKWALIKAGFCTMTQIACANEYAAAVLRVMVRQMEPYAIIARDANLVTIYTAHSQSEKEMGREKFQKSKDAVADIISPIVGYDILEHGGKSA